MSKSRDKSYKHKYGISLEEVEALLAAQDHKCAICDRGEEDVRSTEGRSWFHVDHDHLTGLVRGILCPRCNVNLGWYERFEVEIREHLG